MRTPGELAFTVHVAGAPTKVFPGPDTAASATQRCVACGFLLIDNTPWLTCNPPAVASLALAAEGGDTIEAPAVDEHRGMSWWPAGALVGTDKRDEGKGGMTYLREEGRPLDANERMCTEGAPR